MDVSLPKELPLVLNKWDKIEEIQVPKNAGNIIKLSAGKGHLVALTDQGDVYTMGKNQYGQCGVGNDTKLYIDDECEKKLIDSFVKISRDVFDAKVVDVACGEFHTVFVCNDGNVFTCGLDSKWQLGHGVFPPIPGEFENEHIKYEHKYGIVYDHNVGWRDTPTRVELPLYQNSDNIKSLFKGMKCAAGKEHTVILGKLPEMKQMAVTTWGSGVEGQLGHRVRRAISAPQVLKSLLNYEEYDFKTGQLTPNEPIQIAAGKFHTCILMSSGSIFTFGNNKEGQCGIARKQKGKKKIPHRIRKATLIQRLARQMYMDASHLTNIYAGFNGTVVISKKK